MVIERSRPSADELLARIKAEEEEQKPGKLKIFLGYAAGVGKTYAMLEAAQLQKKEVDLVVAYVETHGRAETEALLEGLEVLPRKQVEYHGIDITEMDLDAVLQRRPRIALVDELAHTNAAGSRHTKRYQDVEELLDAGIDVYTTLNIQHLESLKDVVEQITGISIHETVPDNIVDRASEIKLIDLPPDELLQRLKEGKVYVSQQIARAIDKFFRKSNLTALRELSLRTTAEHVDEQMRTYAQAVTSHAPLQVAERLLALINLGSLDESLIRTARNLSRQLHADWFVIYVETPENIRLSQDEQSKLSSSLRMAEQLGAKTMTLQGHSVSEAVLEFATEHSITKIIVGKPHRPRWRLLLRGSVADQLLRQSEHFDVYVVNGRAEGPRSVPRPETLVKPAPISLRRRWRHYLAAIALVAAATVVSYLARNTFPLANVVMLYLLVVVWSAIYLGRGPSMVASILGVVAADLVFVEPRFQLTVAHGENLFLLIVLLLVGLVISELTSRVWRLAEVAQRRQMDVSTLYDLSRELAFSHRLTTIARTIVNRVHQTFDAEVALFLPNEEDNSQIKPYAQTFEEAISAGEVAVAAWAYENRRPAGHGTDALSEAVGLYLPLQSTRGMLGVMAIWSPDSKSRLTEEQRRLLDAFVDLAALAVERIQLADEVEEA